MTDEERQKLIAELRAIAGIKECEQAADEIEQLDKVWKEWRSIADRYLLTQTEAYEVCRDALAQSNAEPNSLREALADLVKWKNYKDEHGADATYELGKERAWRKARVALAQSDAELKAERDAWRNVAKQAGVCMICALGLPDPYGCFDCQNTGWENQRAREPRPDASAGLIEAAEWYIISQALRIAREDTSIEGFATDAEYEILKEKVRSRAADRSGK